MEVDKVSPTETKKKRPIAETGKSDEPSAKTSKSSANDKCLLSLHSDISSLSCKINYQQNKTLSNIGFSSGPSAKVLAVITNDVGHVKKKLEENGHKELFIVSGAVLHVLDAGYLNSPYEPAKDTPVKFRVFTDEAGKPKDGHKPINLAKMQKTRLIENGPMVNVLTFQSYLDHPKTALRTKCRGEPTDIAGAIAGGGLPMNFMAYADACKITMVGGREDRLSVDALKQYSVVIMNVKIKSEEKCKKGYGLSLTGIEILPDYDVTMSGIYSDHKLYHAYQDIGAQTDQMMKKKLFSKVFENDLFFIRNYFRTQDKNDTVSEKPIVEIQADKVGSGTQVHVAPNNASLQLVLDDPSNIYHSKVMDVHIPEHCFSQRTRTTGLFWVNQLYRFYFDAKIANVVVVHDDYRFRQSDSSRGLSCFVVPNFAKLVPTEQNEPVSFSESQISALREKKFGGIDVMATKDDGSPKYCAWQVGDNKGLTCIVISDTSGVKYARKTDASEPESASHSSHVCQIYQGMSPARGVYMSYFVTIRNETVVSVLVAGIKHVEEESTGDSADLASLVAVPEDMVDVDSVFG